MSTPEYSVAVVDDDEERPPSPLRGLPPNICPGLFSVALILIGNTHSTCYLTAHFSFPFDTFWAFRVLVVLFKGPATRVECSRLLFL